MVALKEVWILSESGKALAELCTCACNLSEKTTALVIGQRSEAERAIRFGIKKAYWLGAADETRQIEDYIETAADLIQQNKPTLVLLRASKRGRLMAGRLGALLRTAALQDVKTFEIKDGSLVVSHMLFGGGAVRVEKPVTEIAIALLPPGAYEPASENDAYNGEIEDVAFVPPSDGVKLLERRKKSPSTVDLTAAKRVIGVGRGVSKQEDLQLVNELAQIMEAEIACTRPIAEGLNWLPRDRYLGVSGNTIKPEMYLALGVSGQVQHMVGVIDSKIIVAVNKDKNAPIFQQADYGIVGDLYKVVPLLIATMRSMK